jgi:hypothetical protein
MTRIGSLKSCSILGLALLTASCGSYGPGPQQAKLVPAPTAESRYRDYHFAIDAEELCGELKMNQDKAFALEQRIDGLIGHGLAGGNSLYLIQDAQEKLNSLHSGGGCTDPQIAAGRAVYDAELKSAVN